MGAKNRRGRKDQPGQQRKEDERKIERIKGLARERGTC